MNIIEFLTNLFTKQQRKNDEQLKIENGLKKWDDFRWIHQAFIGDIITNCNLNDLAVSLIYCDQIISGRFLQIAKEIFYTDTSYKSYRDDLEILIKKHSKVTKEQSDKMKAHIANNILHPDYIKYRNLPYGQSPLKT